MTKSLLESAPSFPCEANIIREPEQSTELAAPAVPSVETMLMHAIDQRIDPAAMRELVALHREVKADKAKEEFVAALQGFQQECPPINRDCAPQGAKFTYASLPHIAEFIRPYLDKFGLSYTFDTSVAEKQITATCKIQHRAGHFEESSFTGPICGTSAMSQIQMAASTISYGKRHALVMALGLTILGEDDERNLPPAPPDRPDQRTDAPQTQPRGDRVTAEQIKTFTDLWKKVMTSAGQYSDAGALGTWVEKHVGIEPQYARHVSHWTREKWEKAMMELEAQHV